MKTINIKEITKSTDKVKILLQVLENKVIAQVQYVGFTEGQVLTIEGAEYDAWGTDDNYIYDLILSKLGLERI